MANQVHECRFHSGCIDLMEEELAAAEAVVKRLSALIECAHEQGRQYVNLWELRDVLSGLATAPPPAVNPWVELTPERKRAIAWASAVISKRHHSATARGSA